MFGLPLVRPGQKLLILCLGAHSDDIEIGTGGTQLEWLTSGVALHTHWCVLSTNAARAAEARAAHAAFISGATATALDCATFRDGHFPAQSTEIKAWLEALKARIPAPDVIFTHRADDAHQDHRELNHHTRTTFRDHLILEYEIPKWDGDIGQPNTYIPVSAANLDRKIELLLQHFATQRSKDWFDADTFRGLARLRGMECRAPERFAEAFFARKMLLG